MNVFIVICAFFGSWLLVAGAIYQAALELAEEQIDREQFAAVKLNVADQKRFSAWWWLLPPVAYVLNARRGRRHKLDVLEALEPEQLRQTVNFFNKSHGWMIVAGGAYLLAVVATWQSYQSFGWPAIVFWVLLVVATGISISSAVRRMLQTQRMLDKAEAAHSADAG